MIDVHKAFIFVSGFTGFDQDLQDSPDSRINRIRRTLITDCVLPITRSPITTSPAEVPAWMGQSIQMPLRRKVSRSEQFLVLRDR